MFDFYRICIHLFGLMLISQKTNDAGRIVLFFAKSMKIENFGKTNVTKPGLRCQKAVLNAVDAIFALICCYKGIFLAYNAAVRVVV